ncbi:MAG: hypothetical protein AAGA23_04575 [Pseudomonadota bacterium]
MSQQGIRNTIGRRRGGQLSVTAARWTAGLALALLAAAGPATGQWSGQFARDPEFASTAFTETPTGFVAAGVPLQFVNEAGDVEYHVLRIFENGRWRSDGDLGVGIFSGVIESVAKFRNDICLGGSFVNFSPGGFNFFACYSPGNGTWYQPGGDGNGPNNAVNSVWFDGGVNLYIGGDFTEVLDDQGTPITANRVARTTGAVWEPLTGDGGATNGVVAPVKVVRTFNGFVFVASGSSVFRYNPTNTTWTPFGLATLQNMVPQVVDDLVFFDNEVIAAGPYDIIGGELAPGIATSTVASGPDWRPLDDGSQGHGSGEPQMAANSSYVYVTGFWPDLPGADALARWTGFVWEPVDTVPLGLVTGQFADVITQPNSDICVRHGGSTGGAIASAGIACKEEPSGLWRGTSQGIEGSVSALAEYNGEVYAGGGFLSAGDDAAASVIARWDGIRWAAVGNGVAGNIRSLAVFQGELFAGGIVTSAGGNPTGGLVAWNGSTWRDVGGPGTAADELHMLGDSLYFFGVGGNCGTVLSRVCRYDGSTIEEVASGLPEPVSVSAIGDYNGQLAVAGNFQVTGGGRQDVIALLDNGSWNIIITFNTGGGALALASDGNDLYFGGQFSTANGAPAPLNRIGRWDGSSLFNLGSGLSGGAAVTRALEIQLHDGQVFVAGDFDSAGGVTSRGVTAWNGSSWVGLNGGTIQTPFPGTGSGTAVAGIGQSLLSRPEGLYVGGSFDQAGDKYSSGIALFTGDVVFASGFEAR